MKKPKTYYLMRKEDLLIIGDVNLDDKDIELVEKMPLLKKSIFLLLGILVITIASALYTHFSCVSEIESNSSNLVTLLSAERDSAKNELVELKRADNFDKICAEVFCSADCERVSHDAIWKFIQECDPWYPDIIMMQAVMESGCGTSDVAKRCNNLFGMKKPTSRKLRCDINRLNKKEIYAEYQNWKTSVIDRILWEKWMFKNKKEKPTIDEYLNAIDKVYNTETEGYAKNIHKHAAKYR